MAAVLACVVACSSAPRARPTDVVTATRYVQATAWTAPPETLHLADVVRAALGSEGAQLVVDPALTETARSIAQRVANDVGHRPPSARLVQRLAWQVGLTDPIPSIVTVHRGGEGPLGDETATGLREIAVQDRPRGSTTRRCPRA